MSFDYQKPHESELNENEYGFLYVIGSESDIETTITMPDGTVLYNASEKGKMVTSFRYGEWGGTQYGASAEPVSYSYIKTNADGTTTIVRRNAATSMRASIILPRDQADYALACIQEVLDKPVSWVAKQQKPLV